MKRVLVVGAGVLLIILIGILVRSAGNVRTAEDEAADVLRQNTAGSKRVAVEFAKKQGVEGLKPLLKSESANVRTATIIALGTLKGDKEATRVLIELANGKDVEDAHNAIIAIASQGAPEAREVITKAFESPDVRRREAACMAVYEYGDESLHPLLDAALDDEDDFIKLVASRVKELIRYGHAAAIDR
jgi:HEAT repeat protein